MEFFTATGKLIFLTTREFDVCRVTRGAHIEHL